MYAKLAWDKYDENELKKVFSLADDYKEFISFGKTEREATKLAVKDLIARGFEEFDSSKTYKEGDKVYFVNRGKNVCAFKLGKKSLLEGIRVLGAHIDSPRLDVKQNPLYEKDGFALLDTHYYGGIKKYQWVTIPLAIYGVVCKKDGTTVDVMIGDKEDDPVLGISDLLVHLSQDQMQKTAAKVIEGEALDVTLGSLPLKGEGKSLVKDNILRMLKDRYGIEEEDFLSAELEIVPASKARDYGLDRSMIAGYGHDDRCCAYSSLRALLDLEETPTYTSCCILVDKEEVGSIGATGAQSKFFENCIMDLMSSTGLKARSLRKVLTASKMLSSDVSAGFDPLFPQVNEVKNSCFLGKGVVFNKYTGSRGKGGCNDASPEFIAYLRKVMDDANVNFQTAELGKVDQGGGGTIAYILGNLNMDVIDAGIPVLNMHSPMEIISKADLYEAYQAYKAFLKSC